MKNRKTTLILLFIACVWICMPVTANMRQDSVFIQQDTVRKVNMLAEYSKKQQEPGPFSLIFKRQNKFLSYLDRLVTGNVDRTFEKKLDVSYIVMPSYTREGSFGIGGGATGLYRLDKTDSIMSPSDVTLIGNATINGVFSLTANGNNFFPLHILRSTFGEYLQMPVPRMQR